MIPGPCATPKNRKNEKYSLVKIIAKAVFKIKDFAENAP